MTDQDSEKIDRSSAFVWAILASVMVMAVGAFFAWVGFSMFNSTDPGLDRSETSQWVAATAAFLTLGAAVVAAVLAGSTYRIELNREEERQKDRRRAQAELVTAWPVKPFVSRSAMVRRAEARGYETIYGGVSVQLWNASPMPISNATVIVSVTREDRDAPISRDRVFFGRQDLSLIPPGISEEDRVTVQMHPTFEQELAMWEPGRTPRFASQVDLWFTDSAGRRWHRRADGGLEPGA